MREAVGVSDYPDLLVAIRRGLDLNEAVDDATTQVDLLAFDRALARDESVTKGHFEFAGKILCVLLDPIKPPEFRDAAAQRRTGYSGIATSRRLQVQFLRSIREYLRTVDDVGAAYAAGFDRLFSETEADPARLLGASPVAQSR